jgi:hypothetical protein
MNLGDIGIPPSHAVFADTAEPMQACSNQEYWLLAIEQKTHGLDMACHAIFWLPAPKSAMKQQDGLQKQIKTGI